MNRAQRGRITLALLALGAALGMMGGIWLSAAHAAGEGVLDAEAARWGQAIPDGGCVVCWGGPDGDTQLGYSTSGKCKDGAEAADVAFRGSLLCTGNDMTLGEQVVHGPDGLGAPIIINLNKVLGVHYPTDLENARKRFIEAGFQGIRNLGYHPIPDWGWVEKRGPGDMQIPCNLARKVVRELDRKGEGTSWYQGTEWGDNRCNIYHFSADAYIGSPGDLGRDFP